MSSKLIAFVLVVTAVGAVQEAYSGGYAVPYQSAKAVGLANAVTAGINDPSAIYVNPAALTEIEGNQILAGFHYINTVSSVENRLTGEKSINRRDDKFLPHLFGNYHTPSAPLTFGLGTYVPFGLATSYDTDAFTRFAALRTELKLFYVTPSIAWRVSPHVSVGGGMSFVHSSALLSQSVFLGGPEAKLRITDTDDSYGYNLGILIKPSEKIRLGLTYRSRVDLNFDSGDVKFSAGPVTSTKLKGTHVPLPPVIGFGANWKVNPEWSLEFGYDFTRWSEFQALKGRFETPLLGGVLTGFSIPQNWKDTNTVKIGTSYQLLQQLVVRAGLAFDESPIPSSTLSPRIPGGDALHLNAGFGYRWTAVTVDFGYMALFYKTREVSNSVIPGSPRTKFDTFQNIVTINAGYQF
jgi:long-chain fatty acid transport protein